MPESVEVGASPPEGQRVVLSSRTRKGGQGREDARARETPRQSRNCLCSGTGSSAEAAPGAGHVRRWPCSWRGTRLRQGPGRAGVARGGGFRSPRWKTRSRGSGSEGSPELELGRRAHKEGCCGIRGAPSSACCGAGGRRTVPGGGGGVRGTPAGLPPGKSQIHAEITRVSET